MQHIYFSEDFEPPPSEMADITEGIIKKVISEFSDSTEEVSNRNPQPDLEISLTGKNC